MKAVTFIGIDRGMQRRFRTREHLARLIGVSFPDEFYERFAWDNLYGDETRDKRPLHENRARAERLMRNLAPGQRIVLLGDEVARAFGVVKMPKYQWFKLGEVRVARMMHTSHFIRFMPAHRAEFDGPAKEFAKSLLKYTHGGERS